VAQAVEIAEMREENVHLKRALKQRSSFPNIIGKSEKMLALFDLVSQVGAIAFDRADQRRKLALAKN